MYILNVTINIEDSIHQSGITWVKEEFIPKMKATQQFVEVLMSEVLVREVLVREETGGKTYSIQFKAPNKAALKAYYQNHDAQIFRGFRQFGDKIVFFRTEMEVLNHEWKKNILLPTKV